MEVIISRKSASYSSESDVIIICNGEAQCKMVHSRALSVLQSILQNEISSVRIDSLKEDH